MHSCTSGEADAAVTLLVCMMADNSSGYFGVNLKPGRPKPYQARVKRDGKEVYLGTFATAEEAALCVAGDIAGGAGGGEKGGFGGLVL